MKSAAGVVGEATRAVLSMRRTGSACQSGEGQGVSVVEGVSSGARDVWLHTDALPVRAGDGVDGAADGDGGFQVRVQGPALARVHAAAGGLADDHAAAVVRAYTERHRSVPTKSAAPPSEPCGAGPPFWNGFGQSSTRQVTPRLWQLLH